MDAFDRADAMVQLWGGLLGVAVMAYFAYTMFFRRKKGASSGRKPGETTGEDPGAAASGTGSADLAAAGARSQSVPAPQGKTVSGFAKWWLIFWLVANIGGALAPAGSLANSPVAGLAAVVMLLSAAVAVGYALLLRRNPAGLYVILAANTLGAFLNGVAVPGYSIMVTTGLIPAIITYFVTRKQVPYPFGRGGRGSGEALGETVEPASPEPAQIVAGAQQSTLVEPGQPDAPDAVALPLDAQLSHAEDRMAPVAAIPADMHDAGQPTRKRQPPLAYALLGAVLLIAVVVAVASLAGRRSAPPAAVVPTITAAPVRLAAAASPTNAALVDLAAAVPTAIATPVPPAAATEALCAVQDGKWTGTFGFTSSGCVLSEPMLTLMSSRGDQVQIFYVYLNEKIRVENGRFSYEKDRDGGRVTIEGAFTSPTQASGTWALTKGTRLAGGTSSVTRDATGKWTASLGAVEVAATAVGRTPTRTPAATPTAAPTLTATAGPVSLAGALDQKLADIQILGMGGASGASIQIIARAAGSQSVSIAVEPGTVLRSSAPGEQDMVVRRLLGLRQGEQRYSPTELIFLPGAAAGPQNYIVDAYCLNFHKDNPSATTSFSVDADTPAAPDVAAVLAAAGRVPGAAQDIVAIQAAVWTVTDRPTFEELASRGYTPNRQTVAALLQSANLDQACAQLFGEACAVPDCNTASNPTGQGGTRAGVCVSRLPGATLPLPATAHPERSETQPKDTVVAVATSAVASPPARAATTTVLDAQAKKLFAAGPDTAGIAVTADAIWVADGEQKRIHHLDRSGAPIGSFQVKAQGEYRGLAWDGDALRLLVYDYKLGSQVLRLDAQGKVLSSFTVPAELRTLAWNAAGESFWTIAPGSDGFLLELGADSGLRQTLRVPVFGSIEGLAWAPDGLWVLSGFGKWHRFSFEGQYLASAELPMEVFAKDPALAWDEEGFLWISVAETREIYQFTLRQAEADAELPSELRSSSEKRAEDQMPLPPPAFRALSDNTNAALRVVNGLSAPLVVALDSASGEGVHESAVVAPGETWSGVTARGGAFDLFASANAAEPVAFYDKVFLLVGYEYTWVIGDAVAIAPPPTAAPVASPTAVPPTAAPTARSAAPTRAATQPKPAAPPAAAPAAVCPDARARITYPANGATISGVTNFLGTANVPDQAYYKFEYKPASSPTWQYLTQFEGRTVVNDKLMDFFTTTIAPGVYDFRLIAVERSGNYPPPCEIRLTVRR